ncbi:MAG: DegV family protein [Candidatus Limivivens sp.]|nr:DegV family protein [Candidatus Limivivens sp.]
MKKVGIMTDSHSGISKKEAEEREIRVLPMPFCVDGERCLEEVTMSREAFYEHLKRGADVSTSQPSPEDVMEMWDDMLTEFQEIVYMPISSGLSGSCQTAMMLSREKRYDGRVFVVDNGRVSTPLHRSVLDALELAEEGYGAADIRKMLEDAREEMTIYIGVSTLEYLKKGGRIKPAVAAVGTVLNIKPILQLGVGTLDIYQKCRKFSVAKKEMLKAMRHDMETRFAEQWKNGELSLLAASSASREETEEWVQEIQAEFPGMKVLCDNLSMGVSCHVGFGGLGVGCSCRPKRMRKQI